MNSTTRRTSLLDDLKVRPRTGYEAVHSIERPFRCLFDRCPWYAQE